MKAKFNTIFILLGIFALSLLSACGKSDAKPQEQELSQQPANDEVEGWYFRIIYAYPMSLTYEPIVLFKDGQYLEIKDKPLEDIDKVKDKTAHPEAWGTWEKKGDTFYLSNYAGHVSDYRLGSGSWFPAFPYSAETPLADAYENITGGNYGNGTHALFKTRIDFPQEGYFYHSSSGAVISPNSSGWNQQKDAGTYSIKDHTMVLRYNDGQEVRLSFAISAKGTPAKPNAEMLFIGGDVFVAE